MGTQSQYHVFPPSLGEPLLSIDLPSVGPFPLPADPPHGPTSGSRSRKTARRRRKKRKNVYARGESHRDATRISMLPDDVLLEIFDICQNMVDPDDFIPEWVVWKWHLLVHVCQRWRQIIFASPNRLNLRIFCTHGTPVRENLGIWPRLPLVIMHQYDNPGRSLAPDDEDNVIAALKHRDLVCYLGLDVTDSQLGKIATALQEPLPMLASLYLRTASLSRNTPVLPTDFLGGSASCLQIINFWGVPFPALPTLLLSASDLVELLLHNIPPTGYISPDEMASCLAALPRLDNSYIGFQSATPRPDRISPPPTRIVLPALTVFVFQGASEYLEDLVGRIDSPQLDVIHITYLNQLVDFQAAQLSRFIDRSVGPKLTRIRNAEVHLRDGLATFNLLHHPNHPAREWVPVSTSIRCEGINWQVSHFAQELSQISATDSTVDHLAITAEFEGRQLEGIDDAQWPHLLYQFSAVKTLHVSQGLAEHIALALEDITEGVFAEALPSLDLIYLADQQASSIEKFVSIRRLSGHPVTVIDTKAEFEERLSSYVREQREDEYVPEWLRLGDIL